MFCFRLNPSRFPFVAILGLFWTACGGKPFDDSGLGDMSTWYADNDGDAYGDPSATTTAYEQPSGYVSDSTDCDDGDGAVNPGATEVCDGIDNDCDGLVDDDDPGVSGASTWYADTDGDGYGDPSAKTTVCDPPSDAVSDATDCDDADGAVNPGATEICDGIDNDCDGLVDDDDPGVSGASTWYADNDGDGFGDPSTTVTACDPPTGAVSDLTDCDDADPTVNPAALEVCGDGIDNDCDGSAAACRISGTLDLSTADAKLVGESAGDYAGHSVSGAGDVDGDGVDDLLVGAYGNDSGGSSAGAAYLVLGPVGGTLDLSTADAKLVGEADSDYAGYSVSGPGDVDGDGYDDLLVGAVESSTASSAGAAYLVLGPVSGSVDLSLADAKLVGESAYDYAGASVSAAGDVDGDGTDDLLVGAYGESTGGSSAGAAYLVLGPVSGSVDLSTAAAKLVGEADYDYAGDSVSGAGDVDGDGTADLLVGAYGDDSGGSGAGAAYLLLGPVSGTVDLSSADAKLVGEAVLDGAGHSVSGAGDVNGDGYDDLLLGASMESSGATYAGAAYLVLGPVSGTVALSSADAKLVGESVFDEVGISVSGAGDVDGDGYHDLLLGAHWESSGGANAGAAYLVLGPVSGTLDLSTADAKLLGEAPGDETGISVSGAGDVDGDGTDDLLLGAYKESSGGTDAGAAYLVYGGI